MYALLSKNKYRVSLLFFIVWMIFFDGNSVVYMYTQYQELKELTAQQAFLQSEIADMKRQKEELFSTDEKLEKYAREQYFFKKDREDIFIIEEASE